jgi:zinc resistance-associated protein
MLKLTTIGLTAAGLTALFIAGTSPAHAQSSPTVGVGYPADVPGEAEWMAFANQRIDVVKAALQLSPQQEKYWPAVEVAIRARANARYLRLMKLAALRNEGRERSPVEILSERADAMAQRATTLKKLVDAWQPLYENLDTAQKLRLRVLTIYALREMRDAVASRRWQSEDDEED